MRNKIKYFVAPVALLAFFFLISTPVFAYRGDPTIKGPNYTPEREKQMQTIMENKDYDGWVKIMNDRPITKKINKDNFVKYADAYLLDKKGDWQGAKALRNELGLAKKDMPKGWAMAQKNKWPKQNDCDKNSLTK